MYVYALFDNETAELVNIKFLHAAVDKLLDIYMHSFQSPKVQESAKRGILCAYELIFSEDIKAYYQNSPISVTVKDFNQQVDGSSAGLAYAIAFSAALIDRKIINPPCTSYEKIAVTGELDNIGNVLKIKNLKQKIVGAIKENNKLVIYPSQNYEELSFHRQTDPDFDALINESGIILKHVSTLKQAFCEIGLFPSPTIFLTPKLASDSSILTLEVSMQNDILLDVNSFSLCIKYDKSLVLGNNYIDNVSNLNKNIKYSENKDNTLTLSFNIEKDISNMLNKNVKIFEMGFLPIEDINCENIYEIKFEEANCTINSYPYEGCGGIILRSQQLSYENKLFCDDNIQNKKLASLIKSKKKLFLLSGILFFSVISIAFFKYVLETSKSFNDMDFTPTNVVLNYSSPSVVAESIATTIPSPEPTLYTLPTSPTIQKTSATPILQSSPTATLNNSITPTPIKTTADSPKLTKNQITDKSYLTTSPNLPILVLDNLDDFASWYKKDVNGYSRLSSEGGHITDKVVRIDYEIKENGNITIGTKSDTLNIQNNVYKKLSFYYKCISEESQTDVVNLFINSKLIRLGTTQEISKNNEWHFIEISISELKDIKSFELFIGCIPDKTASNALSKGSFMICNFKLSQ